MKVSLTENVFRFSKSPWEHTQFAETNNCQVWGCFVSLQFTLGLERFPFVVIRSLEHKVAPWNLALHRGRQRWVRLSLAAHRKIKEQPKDPELLAVTAVMVVIKRPGRPPLCLISSSCSPQDTNSLSEFPAIIHSFQRYLLNWDQIPSRAGGVTSV